MQAPGEVDAAQPRLGCPFEMHQEQQLLQ